MKSQNKQVKKSVKMRQKDQHRTANIRIASPPTHSNYWTRATLLLSKRVDFFYRADLEKKIMNGVAATNSSTQTTEKLIPNHNDSIALQCTHPII